MNNEVILLVAALIVALIFVGQLVCLLYINFINKEYLIAVILLMLIVFYIIALTRYVIDYF